MPNNQEGAVVNITDRSLPPFSGIKKFAETNYTCMGLYRRAFSRAANKARRSIYRNRKAIANAAAGALMSAGGAAIGKARQWLSGRRSAGSIGTVTTQRDFATSYRGGRVGGKGQRAFLRRMRRALLSEQPLNIYTGLVKGSDTSAAGNQAFVGIYLGDLNTATQGDIWNCFKDAYTAAAVTDVEQERLYIKAMSMDVQFKNNGTEQLIVDMYICSPRIHHNSTATFNTDLTGWFGDFTAVGAVGIGTPGISLFQIPGFTRKWRIQKKQTFLVKPDEAMQTTVFGAKNRMVHGRHLQDYACSMKGLTKLVIFNVKGVPENTASDSGLTGYTYAWSSQTRITYARPPGNTVETVGQSK